MRQLLPPRTRIILIADDDRPMREFTLRRRRLALLLGAGAIAAVAALVAVATWGALAVRAARVPRLEKQLDAANSELASVRGLEREVARLRGMEQQVLTMLGVRPPAGADSTGQSAGAGEALGGGAGEVTGGPGESPGSGGLGAPGPALTEAGSLGLIALPPPDLWPVKGAITRAFLPKGQEGAAAGHEGIDLVAPLDTPVRAAGKGVVARAGWDAYLGNYVEITHGLGYVTVYGHCSRLAVRAGDRVDRGQEIAFLGGTGQASAPHLHFEVWKNGNAIDPRLVIPGDPAR